MFHDLYHFTVDVLSEDLWKGDSIEGEDSRLYSDRSLLSLSYHWNCLGFLAQKLDWCRIGDGYVYINRYKARLQEAELRRSVAWYGGHLIAFSGSASALGHNIYVFCIA